MRIRMRRVSVVLALATSAALVGVPAAPGAPGVNAATARPKVVVISLDGARPALVERYLKTGVLDKRTGLGRLREHGVRADQNITATPSVTAVAHVAIATGSTAVHNDISGNSIHPVAGSIGASLSGFGAPRSDVFVVSDHGMAPFHTAVRLNSILANAGINTSLLGIRTTGPAANIYVNLAGREAGGTVTPAEYLVLIDRIAAALRVARDPNTYYNPTSADLFTHVWTRPSACGKVGFCTDDQIGQDTGDVLALMAEGYNFDGTQAPVVTRLGDSGVSATSVYSVPNFYGAHGHDSKLPSMSAILYAAGPHVKTGRKLPVVHNIDIAPTVMEILGVPAPQTMDGTALLNMLRNDRDHDND